MFKKLTSFALGTAAAFATPYSLTASARDMIDDRCAVSTIKVDHHISSISFVGNDDQSESRIIAVGMGAHGLATFDNSGKSTWVHDGRVDVVSSFGKKTLVYRKVDATTELERFTIGANGVGVPEHLESPSQIAATTLQRNAYAIVGTALLHDNGVQFEDSFVSMPAKPVALAATKAAFPGAENGAVAFALANGDIEIWPVEATQVGCDR